MAQTIGDSKLLDAWASDGEIEEPDISKIEQGWLLGEQPPHEFFNWIQNEFGQKINHVLQRGVASWDSGKDYEVGDVVGSGGSVWIAQDDNTDSEPGSSNTDWVAVITADDLATESSVGVTKLSTSAQAIAATDDSSTMTPAKSLEAIDEFMGFQNVEIFDSIGVTAWSVPAELKERGRKALVTVIGGGGGGGHQEDLFTGADKRGYVGGGGGGGGRATALISLDGVSSVDVTVGAGGDGAPGGATGRGDSGGSSSFGAYITCTGGGGGGESNSGSGGSASGSGIFFEGTTPAENGGEIDRISTTFGGGFGGGKSVLLDDQYAGEDGTAPGGGGGGSGGGDGQSPRDGGDGAPGQVIVRW